eukprot:CAMPEP_0117085706 /NCGR_PEP_ID=MMETSP0472-20121206/60217_1 /TAXON_ID=693140 ORGANISM="Tiarina fusus, Strain LIS" /NCGR_SAMPLE_ID=MMETSP0472 /ASSEMBLY_ACC=CAM_ASM_000603 /LENGTH=297 /DNA_ID=CAMNT_0004815005 /DNA_START=153 /DNA_END=1043 /DNA_ORIENTATION=+
MAPPPIPATPPRKPSSRETSNSSRSSRSGSINYNDGQEFGLVPKYLWKKKNKDSILSSPNRSNKSLPHDEAPGSPTTTATTDIPNAHPTNNNNNNNTASIKDTTLPELVEKSPEEISKLLREVDVLLAKKGNKIVAKQYDLVDNSSSSSSSSQEESFQFLKELLLRTEHFQPNATADRIQQHLTCKSEWFETDGTTGSTQPPKTTNTNPNTTISLRHVSKQEKTDVGSIEDGYVRLLPVRDLAGRAIVFMRYEPDVVSQKWYCKTLWYMLESALEDAETASKGISLVVWNEKKKRMT